MRRQSDGPIRRGNGEIRDTTFWQGGSDYRRRDGDRTSDCAGVCEGRRECGGGGGSSGKTTRGDRRRPEGGGGGGCPGRGWLETPGRWGGGGGEGGGHLAGWIRWW